MKQATFRMIHFPKVNRYVGVAWNYDEAVLISTEDKPTYSEARNSLDQVCQERNVELKWFDGEYFCAPDGSLLEVRR
jgi:hypothetical protein